MSHTAIRKLTAVKYTNMFDATVIEYRIAVNPVRSF